MTGDQKKERSALDRLADALVDDILTASDEDILVEAEEDSIDPAKLTDDLRELFERTTTELGKAKLTAAKRAVADARQSGTSVVRIDPADARRRYDAMITQDRNLTQRLTLAARKGEGQSERDIDSAIEDLAELGAFDEEDSDK